MLFDTTARKTIVEERVRALQRDFAAPGRPIRTALGLRLLELGARLAGVDVRLVQAGAGLQPTASR
jgi:hypothetical protein